VINFKVEAKPRAVLEVQAKPESANQPEAVPWILWDTQLFTTASTTSLTYYQTVQSNKSLGNMEGPGQLPEPQYFEVVRIGADIQTPPSVASGATANDGALLNVYHLLFGDAYTTGAEQGIWTFKMSSKEQGPFPLSFLHASGGPTGYGWGTATNSFNYANNGIIGGGWPVNKSITIPPKINFSMVLTWGGTIAVTGGPIPIRIWMAGVLHRRVL
jgi:hypothetical protein